jgi:HEAT repeat protein
MTSQDVEAIFKTIESGRPDAMAAGVAALGETGAANIDPILEKLRTGSPLERWAAAAALGEIGDTKATEPLETALSDDNVSVRIRAAQSLARLGGPGGIPTLIDELSSDEVMTGHPPELARSYANQVLIAVTGQDIKLEKDDPQARREVIERWQAWWRDNAGTFRPR